MTRNISRFGWLGLVALTWLHNPLDAQAWGSKPSPPIPVATNSVCIFRFEVKCGPEAFACPAGPWYSYFPVDPYLISHPQASTFPNWPTSFPAPTSPTPRPPAGVTYYPPMPQASPYGYGVYPVGYYAYGPAAGYWYAR